MEPNYICIFHNFSPMAIAHLAKNFFMKDEGLFFLHCHCLWASDEWSQNSHHVKLILLTII